MIGRIEEMRAERRGHETVVVEYLLGPAALLERLSVRPSGMRLLRLVTGKRTQHYRVRWEQMDLSDAERPRLRCSVRELEQFEL